MHLLVVLWTFSVLTTFQVPSKPRSDREAAGFFGRVKTVEVQVGAFVEQDGAWREQCCRPAYRLTYNIEGKCISGNTQIVPIDGTSTDESPVESRYDAKGQVVGESAYRADGSLLSRTIHKYDDHGNRVETAQYTAEGVLYHRKTFSYTENRLREQIEYYGENGSVAFKMSYLDYDSQGNWLKRVRSDLSTRETGARWRPFTVTYRSLTYY